jgi:hypothetical protein
MASWVDLPYIFWVCLLGKCEISNGYCRAMTRFGIKLCEQNSNHFQFKTKEPRVRQQDMFAARGDVTQFRHREVRGEGPILLMAKPRMYLRGNSE